MHCMVTEVVPWPFGIADDVESKNPGTRGTRGPLAPAFVSLVWIRCEAAEPPILLYISPA